MMEESTLLRRGDADALATGLADARTRLSRLLDAYERTLPRGLEVPYAAELNPPRWEFGHVAWFEEFWIGRHPGRLAGVAATADSPRAASWWPAADALYNSSTVSHTSRWHLDLPSAATTRRYAAAVRERTLALLAGTPDDDALLYPYRLALAHEDMHGEAWSYMAQHLALDVAEALDATGPAAVAPEAEGEATLAAAVHRLGHDGPGFAFDNERGAHEVELAAYTIDRAPVTWARYLPFVEEGGYRESRWWSAEGWAWRQRANLAAPRYLRRDDEAAGTWQRATFGRWMPLDPAQPAVNLSRHEAEAWCRWAGRRLPTEAEWDHAAHTLGEAFAWGQVWEWTASPFAPYPGFVPHPYADYSQPWFDGRPVLRGASFATVPRMTSRVYRNYFPAGRNDIWAGFRTCATDADAA